ncbi:M20/M25/M40 family metallo-hydrolase, partial [Candidatus Woesearchaeota archaeon]|nr:M20/M25/M40 family metallo-hydrolase [Candidatus Woesearchaeota archaeon]
MIININMLLNYIKQLEYKSDVERLNLIKQILKSKKIKFIEQDYTYFNFKGTNIIVDVGNLKSEKHIILSAHFDVVNGSPGANDDASGIAILFNVVKKLRKIKLRNKVKIIFFDDEEIGRFGSISYIKEYGLKDLLAVYHLELCGYGDTIGLWPITTINEDSYALKTIEGVVKEKNIYFERVGHLPVFWGDDLSFRDAGFRHALCISVAPYKDKGAIKRFVKGNIFKIIFDSYTGRIP